MSVHQHQIETDPACCPAGTQDCGCKGQDGYICTADACPGLSVEDIEAEL